MKFVRPLFRLLLGRRLPIISGTIEVSGIYRPIVVHRDRYGIPHIEAQGDEDAWYGVGFCQGQDRSFQLELLLRAARGTLAEIAGLERLPIDRLSRRIGFLHSAERQWSTVGPGTRRSLEAFARGVTDGVRLGLRKPAHEFALLRTKPTRCTALDLLAVSKLQAFSLSSNWDIELARMHILREDGVEALKALDPTYPEWLPVSVPPGVSAGRAAGQLAEDLVAMGSIVSRVGASNGWALAPSRTGTVRPILANDPHLAPVLPPQWYLAHVRTPEWTAAGATFVGSPAFPVGHNDVAAWGVTAGLADNTDLFVETLGADGRSVREGDRFVQCEVREEVIRVKGGADVTENIVVTPRGPIVSPVLNGEAGAISLRATWLQPRPIKGLLNVHRTRSFEQFRRIFEQWPLMSLGMVYADVSGTIGYQLVGEAPKRRKGWGTIPQPGWDPDVGWEDEPVRFSEMPHAVDPPSGILATANNRPAPEGHGPFLGVDWIDGYRVARIFESLEARRDWDLAANLDLQMDHHSLPWRELRDSVLAAPARSEDAKNAIALLKDWDGVVAADSPAAAVFELFMGEISRSIAKAKAPGASAWALGKGFTEVVPSNLMVVRRVGHLVRLLRDRPEGWFNEAWPVVIEAALAAAVKTLRERYGEDPRQWAWGRIRTLTLRHPVGDRAVLAGVFNRGPFPWGGDANTVGQAAAPPSDPTVNPLAIPTLRMVADVGNWEECRFVLAGGQSGNPLSPHYDDMLPLWRRGDGVPIAWSPDRVSRATESTLRLVPTGDTA